MQRAMQSLPSSRRSPSFPWAVLSIDMNLKNFPKKLNSKTSCLRITVPENLDLALEGLIRKVLREQPKIDDIYAFAADYFDMLLKIREKVGTKFAADHLCPFHDDEDAHEMIKLANMFAKPGNIETKLSEVDKTKNTDTEKIRKRKGFSKSNRKSDKEVQNVKQPVATQKKPGRMVEKEKDQKSNETKPERAKKLKLEPTTEDVGDDEEFLKSDSIKLLVEKELMDAAKSQSKIKEKERENSAGAQQIAKAEEAATNKESCTVVDKDYVKTEVKKIEEVTSKANEEKMESESATKNKKEERENKAPGEAITETLDSTKGATAEEIKKELRDDTKGINEEAKTGIRDDNLEIQTFSDHVKSIESSAAEEETEKPFENAIEVKGVIKDITQDEASKETTEAQDAAKRKALEEKVESEDTGKDERVVKEEIQDFAKDEVTKDPLLIEEVDLNPEELCSVVDILSAKPPEIEKSNTEQIKDVEDGEQNRDKGGGINEVKIKTEEVLTNEDKEDAQTQNSVKVFEKPIESTFANKTEKGNILVTPNKEGTQPETFVPENVGVIDELSDATSSAEKLKFQIDPGDTKPEDKTTVKEEKTEQTESEETKPVPHEDRNLTEDSHKGLQDDDTAQTNTTSEEKAVREEPKTAGENKISEGLKEQLQFRENPTEPSENKEPVNMPEEAEGAKGSEIQPENKDTNFAESSETKEESLQQIKTENQAEEAFQNHGKTEDKEPAMNSLANDHRLSGEPVNIEEAEVREQPKVEQKLRNEELKPKEEIKSEKKGEDKMEVAKEENMFEKQKGEDAITEGLKESDVGEKLDHAVEAPVKDSEKEKRQTMQKLIKSLDESEKQETAKTNAVDSTDLLDTNRIPEHLTEDGELNLTTPENELCTVVDSQHVMEAEEGEKAPEENAQPENVQIKTIQTHYYDTLQVPETVTKEFRVHSVENGSAVEDLLNNTNVVLSSDNEQVIEISVPSLDLPKQDDQELYKRDLEDSLVTPSSGYSLNLSELSIQTISEMFLDSEKQYSGLDREQRIHVTKTGEKCGDESNGEKREVEEVINKTIVPCSVKATPVAPRDEGEINEEANVEASLKNEKEQEPSFDSNERAEGSNEGRSTDSDIPFISVEVKTVIETQNLEDEERGDGGEPTEGDVADVQIRIKATIDLPEGVIVDVREEKEYKDEVRQHAGDDPTTSESVPKDGPTSGESESTISSTGTEIKRNDSTQRHFSQARSLITTQSLELDKRNPLLKTRSLSSFRQGVIDFEVWNAIEKELEEAATKIQSNFRGYKARKKLQRENAVHITTEESSCSTTPVEPEPELREERQQSTGEFHDSIVLSEHPR